MLGIRRKRAPMRPWIPRSTVPIPCSKGARTGGTPRGESCACVREWAGGWGQGKQDQVTLSPALRRGPPTAPVGLDLSC